MARGSNLLLPHLHANPRPIVSLDPRQSDTLRAVRAKIDAGTYRLEAVPCLCGTPSNQAYPVAERDRYGLPVGTFLCPRCALMWSSPRLDADSAACFYRDDYRSLYLGKPQAATEFLDRQERLGEGILDTVRRLDIAIGSETRVVDIGCGAGGMLLPFRAAGATVAGCDFGERYLRAGRARGLDLRQGDAATLNEFAPVDLAVACHVLEHIPAPLEALRLWASLLSPAGALYIEVPGVWDALGKGRNLGRFLHIAHVHHYTLATLQNLAEQAGLALVDGEESVWALFRKGEGAAPAPDAEALRTELERQGRWAYRTFGRTLDRLTSRTRRRTGV